MESSTKIAVLGGTGKSGKYLVKQLIKHSIPFRLLHRNPAALSLSHPLMEVVKGDARDPDVVLQLVANCSAVISMIGQPMGEPSIFSDATRNVLNAMNKNNVRRYIVTTGLNVDAPGDRKSPKTKFSTDWMKQNYPKTTADKQVELDVLMASDADWTLVRLPLIEQTDESSSVIVDLEDCPGEKISATALAEFVIDALAGGNYMRRSPFIANS